MTSIFSFLRHSALRDKNRYSREPRADIRSGVYGRPDKAGFLLFSFSLQTQAGELWECSVPAHQLHLPTGLWCYRQGLPHLWLTVVSVSLLSTLSQVFLSLCLSPYVVVLSLPPQVFLIFLLLLPSFCLSLLLTLLLPPLHVLRFTSMPECVWITMCVCYLQALNSKFKRRCIVNACQVIVF